MKEVQRSWLVALGQCRQLFYLTNCPGIHYQSGDTFANYSCFQILYITINQHIYMTCCLIVSTQEMETYIILGMLTLWAPFHVEQNSLYLFFRPQLFFEHF